MRLGVCEVRSLGGLEFGRLGVWEVRRLFVRFEGWKESWEVERLEGLDKAGCSLEIKYFMMEL